MIMTVIMPLTRLFPDNRPLSGKSCWSATLIALPFDPVPEG
jgi:hypothetical protein